MVSTTDSGNDTNTMVQERLHSGINGMGTTAFRVNILPRPYLETAKIGQAPTEVAHLMYLASLLLAKTEAEISTSSTTEAESNCHQGSC